MNTDNNETNSPHSEPAGDKADSELKGQSADELQNNNDGAGGGQSEQPKPGQTRFYVEDFSQDGEQRVIRFPVAEGKEARAVEFLTNAESHLVSIEFTDESVLCFAIEPRFSVRVGYERENGDAVEFTEVEIESYREEPRPPSPQIDAEER